MAPTTEPKPARGRGFMLALVAAFALVMTIAIAVPIWVTAHDVPAAHR